ncbi:MAG: SpoIIE family protein phosphatase [Lachnospiraceae bacterium]|jgi:stage II sporulation protein E|nr:SpoIIE family protein phosphatase [Lachnospiraceae bacterium]
MKKETFIRAVLALCGGFMLAAFLAQGKALASVLRAGLYFSVLFTGYKYGAGIGAVAGTGCGILETIMQEDISSMGMLCLAGVLAGVFRSLGKTGSAMGFLAGAAILGILYVPQEVQPGIGGFFAAAAAFFLVPETLCTREEIRQEYIRPISFYMPGKERAAAERVKAVSDSMERLAKTFRPPEEAAEETDENVVSEGIPAVPGDFAATTLEGMVWKGRYEECREAVVESFREMERILSELSMEIEATGDVSGKYKDKLSRELRMRRVRLMNLTVLEKNGEKKEAYLRLKAAGNRCMTAREVAEAVSGVLEERFVPAIDSRRIVTKEACSIRLVRAPEYMMLHGISRASRMEQEVSGDNFTFCRLPDGRMLFGVADGMGSGSKAFKDSEVVMEMAEQLLSSGFGLEQALQLMNAVLLLKEQEQRPITVDLAVADLYSGVCRFVKAGGVTTFVKKKRNIEVIKAEGLPAGILSGVQPEYLERGLEDGDKIVMVTDGVLDALAGEDKEETMREILSCISGENLQDVTDEILRYARMSGEECRDDMTALAVGIWKA